MAAEGQLQVTVFSRPGCKFCTKAKVLLAERSVTVHVVDISLEPERRAEAARLSGASTVPQVFVGQRCLGGFDALERLDGAGELLKALAPADGDGPLLPPTPLALFAGQSAILEGASPALMARAQELEALSLQFGPPPLSLRGFTRFGVTKKPAQSQEGNVPLNSAAPPGAQLPTSALPDATAQNLGVLLRTSMFQLLGEFYDATKGEVDYTRIKGSREWSVFRAIAAELGQPRLKPDLLAMSEDERKAFLINLYNAMTFHGTLQYGRRGTTWNMYCFYIGPAVSYSLAGAQVSLDDIEHGMLRARPWYFQAADKEFQSKFKLPSVDPRIHMALNCGAKSCPAIAVYDAPQLEAELDDATGAFVSDDGNVRVSAGDHGKVLLAVSEIFKMYIEDFAGDGAKPRDPQAHVAVAQWVAKFAKGERREMLLSVTAPECLQGGRLQFLPYDWSTNGPDLELDGRVYSWSF